MQTFSSGKSGRWGKAPNPRKTVRAATSRSSFLPYTLLSGNLICTCSLRSHWATYAACKCGCVFQPPWKGRARDGAIALREYWHHSVCTPGLPGYYTPLTFCVNAEDTHSEIYLHLQAHRNNVTLLLLLFPFFVL